MLLKSFCIRNNKSTDMVSVNFNIKGKFLLIKFCSKTFTLRSERSKSPSFHSYIN